MFALFQDRGRAFPNSDRSSCLFLILKQAKQLVLLPKFSYQTEILYELINIFCSVVFYFKFDG